MASGMPKRNGTRADDIMFEGPGKKFQHDRQAEDE